MRINTFIFATIAFFALASQAAPQSAPPINTQDIQSQKTLKMIEEGWKLVVVRNGRHYTNKAMSDLTDQAQKSLISLEDAFLRNYHSTTYTFTPENQKSFRNWSNGITQKSLKRVLKDLRSNK